jgi:hypothetical protein
VLPLRVGEVHSREQAPGLDGIVVRDRGLEPLAQRRRLAQLPAEPPEEADTCLVHDRAGRLQR